MTKICGQIRLGIGSVSWSDYVIGKKTVSAEVDALEWIVTYGLNR